MVILIAIAASVIPSLLLYFWLKNKNRDKPGYKGTCRTALVNGLITSLPVTLTAFVFRLIGSLTGLDKAGIIIWNAYKCFTMFALAEEFWKFCYFRKTLRNSACTCTWYDIIVFMTIVGTGFGILESLVLSLTMSPLQAFIRGLTLGHSVYGFVMGWFYGKALYTGKKGYYAVSFLIPYILHGLYDFSLTDGLGDISDIFIILLIVILLIDTILLVVMLVFFARKKKKKQYSAVLHNAEKTAEQ